jgi:hypothetical protein
VDSELRAEFRRALDEVLPPVPWLEAVVIEDLRKRRPYRSGHRKPAKSVQTRLAFPRVVIQLAAALLILMLAGAAAATFLELHNLTPRSAPARMDEKAYQAMLLRDLNRLDSAGDGVSCTTLQSTCPAPGKPVLAAQQRWLDDLNASEPPARFAVVDPLLRRHVAASIVDLNAMFAAYRAQDKTALDRANNAFAGQALWLNNVAGSILISQQVTVAMYTDTIRIGKQSLDVCNECRSLADNSQVDCGDIQSGLCESDVAYAKSAIENFEAGVVRHAAPRSLAAQNARLQSDLARADVGVLAMANADVAGDPSGFNAGRLLFLQALPAINADMAAILGG